jgi:hypothetical protein
MKDYSQYFLFKSNKSNKSKKSNKSNKSKNPLLKFYNKYIGSTKNLVLINTFIIIFIVGFILLILYLTGDLTSSSSNSNPTGPCTDSKYLKCPYPSQEWINKNIMTPDPNAAVSKTSYFKYDTQQQKLCTYNKLNKQLICNEKICPAGMYFDGSSQQCLNNPCDDGNTKCIRGIKVNEQPTVSKPTGMQLILTDYSLSSDAQVSQIEQVYKDWLNDIIINFCAYRNIDIFCVYITPGYNWLSINSDQNTGAKWFYDNFISICSANNVIPGITVYPNFKDSGWGSKGASTWNPIGQFIGHINNYVHTQNPSSPTFIVKDKSILHLVFDNEACQCGSLTDIRTNLNNGYRFITNNDLPPNFTILGSGNVGINFGKNSNKNDIGLGEVYWNIGQSWPCLGNNSQYTNYSPICKTQSSHYAFQNYPNTYIDYLIKTSHQSDSGGNLNNIYTDSRTVPLLSFESLYQQTDGPNDQFCSSLAYWNDSSTQNKPTTGDKACGTFDGFSYWDWDKFEQFMYLYVTRFRTITGQPNTMPYVGLYAAAFIPKFWMKNNKFDNPGYYANLPPLWPIDCTSEKNKCNQICIDVANIPCNSTNDCLNYCPNQYNGSSCKDNKTCQFKK